MQWNNSTNGGFTTGTPWIKVNENYKEINVEKCIDDKDSIFNHYKKLIELRKKYNVISEGLYREIETDDDRLFIFERYLKDSKIISINNFSDEKTKLNLNSDKLKEYENSDVLISNYDTKNILENIVLKPYESISYIKED